MPGVSVPVPTPRRSVHERGWSATRQLKTLFETNWPKRVTATTALTPCQRAVKVVSPPSTLRASSGPAPAAP